MALLAVDSRSFTLLVGLAVSSCAGCGGLHEGGLTAAWLAAEEPPTASGPGGEPQRNSSGLAAADRRVLARSTVPDAQGRPQSVWIRVIDRSGATGVSPVPRAETSAEQAPSLNAQRPTPDIQQPLQGGRWRYPDLEELLARPAHRRPDVHAALADDDPTVRINAAIALSRLDDATGLEPLFEAAQTPGLPMPMRCAAVEALGALRTPAAEERIDELLKQYGRDRLGSRASYVPELHAELIYALTRRGATAGDPRLEAAVRSRSNDVRLAAVRAYAGDDGPAGGAGQGDALPEALLNLRAAGDSELRAAVLDVLVRRRHPDALRFLVAALRDHDLRVRLKAIEGLGRLGGEEAIAALTGQFDDRASHVRRAAVLALAAAGAKRHVLDRAEDESWRVRRVVARSLRRWPDADAQAVARTLLDDPSSQVHRTLFESLAGWPVELSGPLLLRAMAKRSLSCRKRAAETLAARWSPAVRFPVEGPQSRREEELRRLTVEFREQFDLGDPSPAAAASPDPTITPTAEELDRAEHLLARENYARLEQFDPALLPVLTELSLKRHRPLPEAVYRKVLPGVDRAFAILLQLDDEEVLVRRRAAEDLAELAADRPLGRLATGRLLASVVAEQDQLVWIGALEAVSRDGGETAARLATAAMSHPSPEVRRRGCGHFRSHPRRDAVEALSRSLDDPSDAVVAEAVAALGALGELSDREQLAALLLRRNSSLRLEVAAALVKLDDARGTAALERLAHSRAADVRRRTADRMGKLGRTEFIPALIRLLDDRVSVMRAALAALPKVVGRDHSLRDDGTPPSTTERVRRWRQWYAKRQRNAE